MSRARKKPRTMRGMNSDVIEIALSLFGLIAGTVLLAIATARGILGGVVCAAFALLFSCYGITATLYPLIAR